MSAKDLIVRPQPGPQTQFLSSSADIAVYGGAAGGGKTFALLLEPLRHIRNGEFRGVVFRRTMEQVRNEGGLWHESLNLYPLVGGTPKESTLEWRFPSGATIRFEHLNYEKDKLQYQGAQIAFMGFDELTHFSESQFFYMLSRNRSTSGVKPYVRCTTNPDSTSWVKRFLAPWLQGPVESRAKSGETRRFVRDGGQIRWVTGDEEHAKTVTLVKANIFDNPALLDKDPGYLSNLMALPMIDRKRLLEGDWDIVEEGSLFRRDWFEIVELEPECERTVRFWDLASTSVTPGSDPDWTVGALMGRQGSKHFVLDVQRLRGTPAEVERLIRQTAQADAARYPRTIIRMEQEPGSSGVSLIDHYLRTVLPGFDFAGVKPIGGKAERARPLSAMCEAGHVKLVRAAWNLDYLNELSLFPMPGAHDDQLDATVGAFGALTQPTAFHAAFGGQKPIFEDYTPR
ncbi:MAG: phage terminase large subunit [Armatimonadetes bacterium]|nr:phage terminase large subunit [Armatimonadota bacterium]